MTLRKQYIVTFVSNFRTLLSREEILVKDAKRKLQEIADATDAKQQAGLLTELKKMLLIGRTMMAEGDEKPFRALCRFYGIDVNMLK